MMDVQFSEQIFVKALRAGLRNDSVEVVSITNNSSKQKAMNFLSDFFKLSVMYTVRNGKQKSRESVSIVAKTEPTSSKIPLEIVQQQDLFATELRVLRDVLPRIEKLVDRKIGPCLWYGSDNPRVLVMEDLTERGFYMKDRQKGLPFDHCVLVIEQMAKLHAGSVALFERDPELVASFNGGIVSSKCPKYFVRLMETSLLNVSREMKKWTDERCARAADKLKKLADTIGPRCTEAYSYDPDEFCVLNHGDCWTNNLMFKEDDKGQACDLRLVDYQMSTYTSPAIDLLYFLNTCPEVAFKYDHDDYFLGTYLTILASTMESIGCKAKPPTMEQLKKAIHKRRIYAVFSGMVLYLRMIAKSEDTEDFDELFNGLQGETRMDVFKNPYAVSAARKMLPVMDERGYLD